MVKVRFPPSPTGSMHIGTARTLLVNYIFARGQKGKIVFRNEDTDRERSKPEFEKDILDGLEWLGIDFDEGPFRQSERYDVYEKHFESLKKSAAIYPCYCSPEELEAERKMQQEKKLPPRYSGKCRELGKAEAEKLEAGGRKAVWRFRVPEKEIAFVDLVRGEIKERGEDIADFVIRKSDGQFLYHFTVCTDDAEMGITHVIRGDDHISNTSKHIVLFEALGTKVPEFAHLPLLLNKDKSKMSKRDESGKPATIERLKSEGYLPEAVINFLALLGWNPGSGSEKEFFTMKELQKAFDFKHVAKAGAVFDIERLNFFNAHYLRKLSPKKLAAGVKPFLDFEVKDEEVLAKAVKLAAERMKYFAEAPELIKFFFELPDYDAALFVNPKMKVDAAESQSALTEALKVLESLDDWTEEKIQEVLLQLVDALGIKNGQLLWPVRVALTGQQFSPGVWEVADALKKDESLARIRIGLDKLGKKS